jgi:anti-anti-sigma factor
MAPRFFETQCRCDTLIVTAAGNISSLASANMQTETNRLLEKVRDLGIKNLVFDLSKADCFGTSMLELMHALWRHMRQAKGTMALCNVSKIGREILGVTRLDTLWPVCDTLEEAINIVAERALQEESRP